MQENRGDSISDQIESLYKNVLGRSCDTAGLATYKKHMKNGMTIKEIERCLKNSEEYAIHQGFNEPTDYNDGDITFELGLYHDRKRADGALKRLREHFPDSRVIIRSDGDKDPQNRNLAIQFGADYFEEERLYPIEYGGNMTLRLLELYLDKPTPFLFKIDTDTAIHRRFHFLPKKDGLFGSLQHSSPDCVSIQGGGIGFSRKSVEKILDSDLLRDKRLCDPISYRSESEYFDRMAIRVNRCGLCSFDWIIGWVAAELDIPMFTFTEMHCRWLVKNNVNNNDLRFALTHPVYFEKDGIG